MITGMKLAPIFSDGLVIQSNKPFYIFGEVVKETKLHIELLNKQYDFDIELDFCIELESLPITKSPFDITLKSLEETFVIKNCLVGDVYLCTGQSNMQYMCKDVINVEYIDIPTLRLYEVPKLPYIGAEKEFDWLYANKPKWDEATKKSEELFSAIGYMIGRDISLKYDIPVGIISCNMGDTTIYSWLSKGAIENQKELKPYLDDYNSWQDRYSSFKEYDDYYKKQVPKLMDFYGLLDKYRAEGYSSDEVYCKAYERIPDPYLPMGPKNQNRPSGCYETMLETIIPYSNKCIIYYQGENDVSRPDIYRVAIQKMIEDWRHAFRDSLPFINCQLAGHEYSDTPGYQVAKLRDAQASVLDLEKKQYVVTAVDYGEKSNIHPLNKTVVAKRIFNVIDEFIYLDNKNSLSPMIDSFKIIDNVLQVKTKYNKLDLVIKNQEDNGFYAIDFDGYKHLLKEIKIDGTDILIAIEPSYNEIMYAYDGFPQLSIYTENDLPVLPFHIKLK